VNDHEIIDTVGALRWQADYCRSKGSPVAGAVCDAVADDAQAGGPTAAQLPERVRSGDWIGLRVMGLVHRMAIARRAPGVAVHAPTLGGTSPFAAADSGTALESFAAAVVDAVVVDPAATADALARTPQTNEVGRSRALRVALSRCTTPVRLLEVGASAGLNLRCDRLPGDPALEDGPIPPIVERLGCDLDPVDSTTPQGRLWLSGFVWLDDVERFAALGAALEVAASVPAEVIEVDAVTFLDGVAVANGCTTVVWHSAVWPYLHTDTRTAVTERLERIGSGATADAPLWHVSWEPGAEGPEQFELVIARWEGGGGPTREVAVVGNSHGQNLRAVAGGRPWVG
jgi:hypothetical protein